MAGTVDLGFLNQAAIFLGAAVIAVPIAKRLRMGSVLGYLTAGAVVGPFGLGLIANVETVLHTAEFGVILLLFVIGLELTPSRLWRLRGDVFGLGSAQVLLSGAALCAVFIAWGQSWQMAIMAGAALALSSTAFATQIMRERRVLTSPYGDRAFSILLFQDLAIVPLIGLAAFLRPGGSQGIPLIDIAIAVAVVAGLLIALRFGLRPLFTFIARTRTSEIFTAAALLVVVGSALIMDMIGLSMALGAFLAGILLAESEFRHQLEADIEPFRGLLLGLFFMGFGMTVDWSLVLSNWVIVIGGAIGLFVLKAALLFAITRPFGSTTRDSARIGATIGQGGEFAFVLVSLSAANGLMTGDTPSLISAVVTLSMAITPLAVALAERIPTPAEVHDDASSDMSDITSARVIIAGFGRVGQVVARILAMRGTSITLIDGSPRRIRMAKNFGNKVYFGDATRLDILAAAGADEADILFLCIDDREGARYAVERVKERFPGLAVYVDTYDRFSEIEIRRAGADFTIRETRESAIAMARAALEDLGDGDVADEVIDEYRKRDAELFSVELNEGREKALEAMRGHYQVSPKA